MASYKMFLREVYIISVFVLRYEKRYHMIRYWPDLITLFIA